MVVEAHSVDEGSMLRQAEQTRLGITRLGNGSHGANLYKAKTASSQPKDGFGIFI
jgi:hypothetical protein